MNTWLNKKSGDGETYTWADNESLDDAEIGSSDYLLKTSVEICMLLMSEKTTQVREFFEKAKLEELGNRIGSSGIENAPSIKDRIISLRSLDCKKLDDVKYNFIIRFFEISLLFPNQLPEEVEGIFRNVYGDADTDLFLRIVAARANSSPSWCLRPVHPFHVMYEVCREYVDILSNYVDVLSKLPKQVGWEKFLTKARTIWLLTSSVLAEEDCEMVFKKLFADMLERSAFSELIVIATLLAPKGGPLEKFFIKMATDYVAKKDFTSAIALLPAFGCLHHNRKVFSSDSRNEVLEVLAQGMREALKKGWNCNWMSLRSEILKINNKKDQITLYFHLIRSLLNDNKIDELDDIDKEMCETYNYWDAVELSEIKINENSPSLGLTIKKYSCSEYDVSDSPDHEIDHVIQKSLNDLYNLTPRMSEPYSNPTQSMSDPYPNVTQGGTSVEKVSVEGGSQVPELPENGMNKVLGEGWSWKDARSGISKVLEKGWSCKDVRDEILKINNKTDQIKMYFILIRLLVEKDRMEEFDNIDNEMMVSYDYWSTTELSEIIISDNSPSLSAIIEIFRFNAERKSSIDGANQENYHATQGVSDSYSKSTQSSDAKDKSSVEEDNKIHEILAVEMHEALEKGRTWADVRDSILEIDNKTDQIKLYFVLIRILLGNGRIEELDKIDTEMCEIYDYWSVDELSEIRISDNSPSLNEIVEGPSSDSEYRTTDLPIQPIYHSNQSIVNPSFNVDQSMGDPDTIKIRKLISEGEFSKAVSEEDYDLLMGAIETYISEVQGREIDLLLKQIDGLQAADKERYLDSIFSKLLKNKKHISQAIDCANLQPSKEKRYSYFVELFAIRKVCLDEEVFDYALEYNEYTDASERRQGLKEFLGK